MGIAYHKLGLITGSNSFDLASLSELTGQNIDTTFGPAYILRSEKYIVLPRHGEKRNIPPHMINHRANISALKASWVDKIISFTSVGSLSLDLKPTSLVMPDDYINLGRIHTVFDNERTHIVPGLDNTLREQIYKQITDLPVEINFNGVYIQTRGPRLETRAEINMLKAFGDVVGMTMASEATLAKELGIGYANISVVDNFCNGIADEPLTIGAIEDNQAKNARSIELILEKIL